jgi:hypothetical protein
MGGNESEVLCAEEDKVKTEQRCPANERNFDQNNYVISYF